MWWTKELGWGTSSMPLLTPSPSVSILSHSSVAVEYNVDREGCRITYLSPVLLQLYKESPHEAPRMEEEG